MASASANRVPAIHAVLRFARICSESRRSMAVDLAVAASSSQSRAAGGDGEWPRAPSGPRSAGARRRRRRRATPARWGSRARGRAAGRFSPSARLGEGLAPGPRPASAARQPGGVAARRTAPTSPGAARRRAAQAMARTPAGCTAGAPRGGDSSLGPPPLAGGSAARHGVARAGADAASLHERETARAPPPGTRTRGHPAAAAASATGTAAPLRPPRNIRATAAARPAPPPRRAVGGPPGSQGGDERRSVSAASRGPG